MRKFMVAACLAAGLFFAFSGSNVAQAQNCGPRGYSGYRGGFSPYGQFYQAPVVRVGGFHPGGVGIYSASRVNVVPFGYGGGYGVGGFGGGYGARGFGGSGFGGGYGVNPYMGGYGYNNFGPRSVLRIGF